MAGRCFFLIAVAMSISALTTRTPCNVLSLVARRDWYFGKIEVVEERTLLQGFGNDLGPQSRVPPLTQSAPQRFVSRSCVIPLDRLSGLWQLVEEVVHGAEDLGFVGIEDVVPGIGQTDHLG
jgi:hypothetical protein